MTTIFDKVETALATLSGVTAVNDTLILETGEALPDVFLTWFVVSSPPGQHADDQEALGFYRVQVSVYSRAGLESLPDVNAAMTAAGFLRSNTQQIPYSRETRHYGLALEYTILF